MTDKELIKALRRAAIYYGITRLFRCGHKRRCGICGYAITRAAADRIEELSASLLSASPWISVKDRLPETDNLVIAIVSGKPISSITLVDAPEIASYWHGDEDWFIDAYPEWEHPDVSYWMPIPEMPGEEAE